MFCPAALVSLLIAAVALPAAASASFIDTRDYTSITIGSGDDHHEASPAPRDVVPSTSPPPQAPPPRLTAPVPAASPPTRTLAPAQPKRPARKPDDRPHRTRPPAPAAPVPLVPAAQMATAPGVAPVRATATVAPVVDDDGTSGPSLALLIAVITALGCVAVLILRARPEWFLKDERPPAT